MSDADPPERIDVRGDGRVILYKRKGLKNPKWQVRISVPNAKGYKIVTTKTADRREAERFALNLYEDTYMHVRAGGSIVSKTFRQVFEEWKSHVGTMGHTRQGGSWDATIARIETYGVKFFGNHKITAIGPNEFTDFWAWRKANFNKKAPSNATLRRERTCLLPVFKFAVTKGYIVKIPETAPPKASSERRPTFSRKEWKVIKTAVHDWVDEGRKLATWRDRVVAQHCFLILANSGLRPGELRRLRWGDVWKTDGWYLGRVQGKTGSRDVVFQPGAEASFQALHKLRCKELAEQDPEKVDAKPGRDAIIICHPNGTPVTSMKHSFESLMRFAGVPQEKDGRRRTIYSLRHYYATRQLSKAASPYLVANQMGTSVEMLERHYGHPVSVEVAAQITKSAPVNLIRGDFIMDT